MENEPVFDRETLEFHMPEIFKGMHKSYMLTKMFDEKIQKKWKPETGDVMVGSTGNIFVISNVEQLHEKLGGDRCYFYGHMCNRTGWNVLNETASHTMNKDGKWIGWSKEGELVEMQNYSHSKQSHFRFVPYPHEVNRM